MTPRERFEARRKFLAEDEEERLREAAARSPGENLAIGLALADAALGDWRRLVETHPALAVEAEERALHKADLHLAWRARHPRP
jgi:hypothetical protein